MFDHPQWILSSPLMFRMEFYVVWFAPVSSSSRWAPLRRLMLPLLHFLTCWRCPSYSSPRYPQPSLLQGTTVVSWSLLATRTLRSFSVKYLSSQSATSMEWCMELFLLRDRIVHFFVMTFMRFLLVHISRLSRFLWMPEQLSGAATTHPRFVSYLVQKLNALQTNMDALDAPLMFGTGFRENLLYHPPLDSSPLTGFNFRRALSLLTAPLHAQTASSHFSWIICPFFYFLHTSFSHLSFVRNSSLIHGAFCPSWRKAPQLCFVIIMLLLITSLFACQTSPPLPH